MHDRVRAFEARPEPIDPPRACRTHRGSLEFGGVEWQHDLERDAFVEEGLGDHDVRARSQRPVRESHPLLSQIRADLAVHGCLEFGRKAAGAVGGIDAVSAVVEDCRRVEFVQHRQVRRRGVTDESELASCHCQCREIVPRHGDGAGKGTAGRLDVTKNQRGLRFGRVEPIVVGLTLASGDRQTARLLRQPMSSLEVARQQPQCRRVDARVEAAIPVGDCFVQVSSVS